jgi:neurofibromin 1
MIIILTFFLLDKFSRVQLLGSAKYESHPFSIILDCTGFTSNSEVPLPWLKTCAELIPSDIRTRFLSTYVLNANGLAQKYIRRLYNVGAGATFLLPASTVNMTLTRHPAEQ